MENGEIIKVDFHLHTNCSDGIYSPSDTLDRIVAAGVRAAAIADHEALDGYYAVKEKIPADLTLIPAVEFSTYYKDSLKSDNPSGEAAEAPEDEVEHLSRKREIHILGYFPGLKNDKLDSILAELQQERVNRAKVGLVNLRKNGCRLGYEQLSEHVMGKCVSRAHIARAMVTNGLVSSIYEAFNRYLDISLDIVPPPLLTPSRAISIIRGEGGIPVWAHPQLASFDLLVKKFVDEGLEGVEICNNRRGESYSLYFERTARVLGLYATYGSDWHGFNEESIKGIDVPLENISAFLGRFEGDSPTR